jgi:hypothetical protein
MCPWNLHPTGLASTLGKPKVTEVPYARVMRRLVVLALAMLSLAAPGIAEAAPSRVVASAWVEGTYSLPGVLGYRSVHFTLYADGHLLTTGRDDARGVTTYEVAKISPRESRQLRRLLVRATDGIDFGDVPVADVGYTRTRVVLDGRVTTSNTNALEMDTGLTPAQTQARERLRTSIQRFKDVPADPFIPPAYEVRLVVRDEAGIQLEWPGPPLPAGECGQISRADYLAFPDSYRQGDRYTWRGQQFDLWTRPLMPGERACRL